MIEYPFVIISDIHCNDWSQFSHTDKNKINNRLNVSLNAIKESVKALTVAGGKDLIVTGDLFHTRGRLKPSVFNPVFRLFQCLCADGIKVHLIPGNHDLEGRESNDWENATYPFHSLDGMTVYSGDYSINGDFVFIPWIEHKDDFVAVINSIPDPEKKTVFCHIGIDGVLEGVAGKVGKAVLNRGFKNVFSGDYHNYANLGDGIYSVGALTHQSFSDAGSISGFLLVEENKVTQRETSAPKFVINPIGGDEVPDNIIRITGEYEQHELDEYIANLREAGALFVQDMTTRTTLKDSTTASKEVRVDLSLDTALQTYTQRKYGSNHEAVLFECRKIINESV